MWSWYCWLWSVIYYLCCASLADSPKRFWWYHWICWTLSAVGIFCILLAHDHYTVDVVVAYFITTRLFWWYHTMANQQVSMANLAKYGKEYSSKGKDPLYLPCNSVSRLHIAHTRIIKCQFVWQMGCDEARSKKWVEQKQWLPTNHCHVGCFFFVFFLVT